MNNYIPNTLDINDRDTATIQTKAMDASMQGRAPDLRALRLPLGAASHTAAANPESSAFVDRYIRRGLDAGLELKSFTGATGPDGGFAIPREIDAQIDATLKSLSPIRAIANVVQTGSAGYRKLIAVGGTPSGWVAETAGRPETTTPAFSEIVPPSTLLSPANNAAMGYLQLVARAFVAIAKDAGLPVRFQIGEPWWWVTPDGRPCIYDAAATAALGATSVPIETVRGAMAAPQNAMLNAAGALLTNSTNALANAVRDAAGSAGATLLLLIYLPGSFDAAAPELRRANCPIGWAYPAFDVLQTEDYEWVTGGRAADSLRAADEITTRLGYPAGEQHYMAGFVLNAADAPQWAAIDAAADDSRRRGVAATIIWALPQICRDGFVHFGPETLSQEDDMTPIDDIVFPIDIGREAKVVTEFLTDVATSLSGHEQRLSSWANARMAYDAGPGVRSEADVGVLTAFFRDRRGQARGFRFRDPFDSSSAGEHAPPSPGDVVLGIGTGSQTRFALIRPYGSGPDAQVRRITRPVPGSVRIAVNGVEAQSGWTIGPLGIIDFATAPASGATITAGYQFDVPVRFASDNLEIGRATFAAGDIDSVPLVEIREG